jgi:hypothetical protein
MRNSNKSNYYYFRILLHLQKNKVTEDQDGYAMLITAIIAILIFSLLSVYLFSTNLYKSVANSVVDSGSTFYAAESGMNKRANAVRLKFDKYSQPIGQSPVGLSVVQQMQQCIDHNSYNTAGFATDDTSSIGTDDFKCQVDSFNYRESMWKSTDTNSFTEEYDTSASTPTKYLAYSFVRKLTGADPDITKIPAGEPFAGLNMQEYKYRVYTTAIKKSNGYLPVSAQTMLQMDFNSRIIPLFQFAAFYNDDMEFEPGSDMTFNGSVHTNGNLMFAPHAGANLTMSGPISASLNVYKSLGYHPKPQNTQGTIRENSVVSNPNQFSSVKNGDFGAGSSALNWPEITSKLADIGSWLRSRVNQLQVPEPGFMSKVDTTQTGGIGTYYGKADLQLEFLPTQPVPFKLTAVKTGMTAGGCNETGQEVTISSDRQGGALRCSVLNEGQLRSLQQPVLIDNASTNQAAVFCPTAVLTTGIPTVDAARKAQVVRALQTAIVSQDVPVPYSSLSLPLTTAVKDKFISNLDLITGLTEKSALTAATITPAQIAAVNGGCFSPPPIQAILSTAPVETDRFYDRHEERTMNLLQTNIKALTAWNYYNISVGWTAGVLNNEAGDNNPATNDTGNNNGQGNKTDELLFQRATLNTSFPSNSLPGLLAGTAAANKSFGAADRSEGGLVFHATINKSTYSYDSKKSPYGFAFAQGKSLPAPLTIASDQAIYVQGDYNNSSDNASDINNDSYDAAAASNDPSFQPAALMGDTINVLSRACWDDTRGVKGSTSNQCARPRILSDDQIPIDYHTDRMGLAKATTVRAAFLGRTEKTNPAAQRFSGGVNNYPRFLENWTNGGGANYISFKYYGSFISLGEPIEFGGGGVFDGGRYYQRPKRDWFYDEKFNSSTNLPPLTPRVVYVKQKVFKRDYDSNRS